MSNAKRVSEHRARQRQAGRVEFRFYVNGEELRKFNALKAEILAAREVKK